MILDQILQKKSNNYICVEKQFKKKYKKDLIFDKINPNKFDTADVVDIIIPFMGDLKTLIKALLSINYQRGISNKQISSVIIINDNPKKLFDIKYLPVLNYNLKIITNTRNFGAAISRNIGIANSNSKYLLFMDSDCILEPDYILQHLVRHAMVKNVVTFSLRKKVLVNSNLISNSKIISQKIKVRYNSWTDFRHKKDLRSVYNKKFRENKIVYLLKESNYLKNYKYNNKFYLWTLPMIISTHNLFLSREVACKVGGFDSNFRFAQWEDVAFGAKLIATNQLIIPCLATSVYCITKKRKYNYNLYFRNNEKIYTTLLNSNFKPQNKTSLKKYCKYISKVVLIPKNDYYGE